MKKPYDISSSSVGVTVVSDLGAGQNQICEVVSESGLLKIFGQNFSFGRTFLNLIAVDLIHLEQPSNLHCVAQHRNYHLCKLI